ncbi:MAG: replication initiation factor, partial [Gallionella sp.]
MSHQSDSNRQSSLPSSNTTDPTAAERPTDRTNAQRVPVVRELGEGGKGTTRSNTVPYNCNSEYFKLLRFGVDSLYLSYRGDIFPEVQERLTKLKQLAQHPEPYQQAMAQYAIAGHIFEVKDKGSSVFPFVIEDGAFRISLSRASKYTPMAYVKMSSRYLSSITPKGAEEELRSILNELGTLTDSAHVSRIDLCGDFVSRENMESWGREAWVTRGKNITAYAVDEKFTGWSIGLGGNIACRLYNKLLEIITSNRLDLIPLWEATGRKPEEPVWRVEFQIMREVLAQHGIVDLESVLANLNGLWSYATTGWLRLTLPNPDDQTRSRWPLHPLWGYLSSIDWETDGGPLARSFKATRLPEDERIFALGASSIASYMAKHAIT